MVAYVNKGKMTTKVLKNKHMRVLLAIIVLFILTETVVRFFWIAPEKTYEKGLLINNKISGYTLNPGFEGFLLGKKGMNIPVKINSQGMRDEEYTFNKSQRYTRIIALGDTIFFGSGIEYKKTALYILEEKFKESGFNVEIVNMAAPGYQPSQEYNLYFINGYKYDQDIILIGIGMNDILPINVSETNKMFESYGDISAPDSKFESFVKKICHSCTFAYSLIYNRNTGFTKDGYLRYVYSKWSDNNLFNIYSQELINFNNILEKKNKKIVLVLVPFRIQMTNDESIGFIPQNRIKAVADKYNIEVIDLAPYLDKKEYKEHFSGDGRILSAEGHRIMQEVLYKELMERDIIIK